MKLTFVQIVFIIIILFVGVIVYQELPNPEVINTTSTEKLDPNKKGCPALQVRECIQGSYGRNKYKCPVAPDECNGQQDSAACFRYEWKDPKKAPCPVCDSPKYTKKTAVRCN
jgi:hypothetical protein